MVDQVLKVGYNGVSGNKCGEKWGKSGGK